MPLFLLCILSTHINGGGTEGFSLGVAVQVNLVGTTALHDAAAWEKFGSEYAAKLLKAGADPNLLAASGFTPLHIAAARGQAKVARLLIKAGANPMEYSTHQGITPLYFAVQRGHADAVQVLLSTAPDSHAQVVNQLVSGQTALHAAALRGDAKIARLLLDAGAEQQKTTDQQALTPLEYAQYKGHTKLVRLLRQYAANKTAKSAKPTKQKKRGRKGRRKATRQDL
jgi:ankyrin repeat protein